MEHPNIELYRRVTAAFQSGDIDAVKGALAPGLRWHEAGNPEVMGRDAVLQQMSGDIKRIDGNIALHDVLANDDHVVALINVALRKTRRVGDCLPRRRGRPHQRRAHHREMVLHGLVSTGRERVLLRPWLTSPRSSVVRPQHRAHGGRFP
jgi:SnoaL-like domain